MLTLHNKSGMRWAVVAMLLVGGALLLNGCDSDPVTPDDDLPALSEQDVAQQAGAVATILAKLSPEIITFQPSKAAKELGVYPYDFSGNPQVSGSVTLEFFSDSVGGTHVDYQSANYGMLYTDPGEMLHVEIEFIENAYIMFELGLMVQGSLDREAGSAVVSGSGTFVSGPHPGDFQFTGLGVSENNLYPTAGTLMFTSAEWTMSVIFDGDETAVIQVDSVPAYVVNMVTGMIEALDGPGGA